MKKNHILLFVLAGFILLSIVLQSASFAGQREAVPAKDRRVTFNFVDVELPVITKFISDITGKNFIFDERVKGKITIIAPSKLTIDDAYNLFTSVLELKGFTVIPSGVNAYKIISSAEARQRGIEIAKDKQTVNESYIARLVSLKNISADDALRFLQPVVSKDGYVSAFGPGNLLLLIDSGLNVEKILSILDSIDQPSMSERPEIVLLRHSSSEAVAKMLNEGMSRKSRAIPQPFAIEEAKAIAETRLNAIVLFGDKGGREAMKSLIALVDVPAPAAQGRINVYFLENADAPELAKVLEGIIKSAPQRQAAQGIPPVTAFEAAGGITVTADKASNALIVVASPSDYQNLLQVMRQLDKKRRQVFVEAMIVEASIDKLSELGTKWRVIGKHNGDPVAIGGFGTMDTAAVQSVIAGLQGATLGGLGNFLDIPLTSIGADGTATTSTLKVPGFAALFSMDEFKDAVNVLSTPQILTSDNKEAEIVVGENVPFITKREADATRTASVFSTIERKDVGITLRITPQVSEGDYVKLDIFQEISALKRNETENILISVGPSTTKRSTRTSVVVKDEQTVVIGGLMQEREEESIMKVPVLGDLPLLGWLFKNKSHSRRKTNLLVFLTPHVVKEDRLAQITKDKQKEFGVAEKRFAEGELLVRFKESVSDENARKLISGKGAAVIKFIEGVNVYHIKLSKEQDVGTAVREFSLMPEVQYAEPDYQIRMHDVK